MIILGLGAFIAYGIGGRFLNAGMAGTKRSRKMSLCDHIVKVLSVYSGIYHTGMAIGLTAKILMQFGNIYALAATALMSLSAISYSLTKGPEKASGTMVTKGVKLTIGFIAIPAATASWVIGKVINGATHIASAAVGLFSREKKEEVLTPAS